jgi:hypothetical protein
MKAYKIPFIIIFIGCAIVFLAVSMTPPKVVAAQCASPSSCKTCHETNGQDPVSNKGIWHTQHASFDYCTVCHGGSQDAADKDTAHQGIVVKVGSMTGTCVNCHQKDYQDRLATYTAALGVNVAIPTPGALCTPTPSVFGSEQSVNPPASGVVGAIPTGSSPSGNTKTASTPNRTGNLILTVLLIFILAGGGTYVVLSEKKRKLMPVLETEKVEIPPAEIIPPEVTAMTPELAKLTPAGLKALHRLLRHPKDASDLFVELDKEID